MTRGIKIFFITFILSLPFWWGVSVFQKNLEDFLFWERMAVNPELLTAQIVWKEKLEKLKPLRNRQVDDFEILADAAISVFINKKGLTEKILFKKEIDKELPIASVVKLMTANVVLKNYDLSQEIKISKEAVEQKEEFGKLKVGQIFSVKHLLYPLLIESSNDAAYALANDYQEMTEEIFVNLMNLEAKNLDLKNTHFVNSTGLDPENPTHPLNYSTAEDLVKLSIYLLNQPSIWEITATPKFALYGPELINTNKLLGEISGIIGGKTGETPRSNGSLLLVLKAPRDKGYLINIILGSENRFEEMKKLIEWVYKAYRW